MCKIRSKWRTSTSSLHARFWYENVDIPSDPFRCRIRRRLSLNIYKYDKIFITTVTCRIGVLQTLQKTEVIASFKPSWTRILCNVPTSFDANLAHSLFTLKDEFQLSRCMNKVITKVKWTLPNISYSVWLDSPLSDQTTLLFALKYPFLLIFRDRLL